MRVIVYIHEDVNLETEILGIDVNRRQYLVYDCELDYLRWQKESSVNIKIDELARFPEYLSEDPDIPGLWLPKGLHAINLDDTRPDFSGGFDFWLEHDNLVEDIWLRSKPLRVIDSLGFPLYPGSYKYIDKDVICYAVKMYLESLIDIALETSLRGLGVQSHFYHQTLEFYSNIEHHHDLTADWRANLTVQIEELMRRLNPFAAFPENAQKTLSTYACRKLYVLLVAWVSDEGSITVKERDNASSFFGRWSTVITTQKHVYTFGIETVSP
jgi:hypothetical protein